MKKLPLSQGKFALVDDDDFKRMNKHKWCCTNNRGTFYAIRTLNATAKRPKRKTFFLHREILRAKKGQTVDHRNGNGLDNRKRNIRICTQQQNTFNKRNDQGSKCEYKGVTWSNESNKWKVRICVDGKSIYLGVHFCIVKAAKIYDEAAVKYHGDFARLNFPK